jgi:hypothetical protein
MRLPLGLGQCEYGNLARSIGRLEALHLPFNPVALTSDGWTPPSPVTPRPLDVVAVHQSFGRCVDHRGYDASVECSTHALATRPPFQSIRSALLLMLRTQTSSRQQMTTPQTMPAVTRRPPNAILGAASHKPSSLLPTSRSHSASKRKTLEVQV